jgi:hypothetical protein
MLHYIRLGSVSWLHDKELTVLWHFNFRNLKIFKILYFEKSNKILTYQILVLLFLCRHLPINLLHTFTHIYTCVNILLLKCVINAEMGCWTKWNITVTASLFCITSVILFHAHHTSLVDIFPCFVGLVKMREVPPWEYSSKILMWGLQWSYWHGFSGSWLSVLLQ